MKAHVVSIILALLSLAAVAQPKAALQTPFRRTGGRETTDYFSCVSFYRQLSARSKQARLLDFDTTDAGYPLQVLLYNKDGKFDPAAWDRNRDLVVFLNNGIHPGEPDGIDASMNLLSDLESGAWKLPDHIILAVVPAYNIGGMLNRRADTRVNQNGPAVAGFRGNAQNLDLNRDFIKCDSREARAFARIFHFLDPDIFIDTHVSDGADYRHAITLLSTHYSKLGGRLGQLMRQDLDPALYASMRKKSLPMIPYFPGEGSPEQGWKAFYDGPRFGSGYAALFQCPGYVIETHMLKPFPERVAATDSLVRTILAEAGARYRQIREARIADRSYWQHADSIPLRWQPDTSLFTAYEFMGYRPKTKPSAITGGPRMFYDHSDPYTVQVKVFDRSKPVRQVRMPRYYAIPQGWHEAAALLVLNGVNLRRLERDTTMQVTQYRIQNYETVKRPYEKHYLHFNTAIVPEEKTIKLLAGDWLVAADQPQRRFLAEVLEPEADDSYFSWNFFDAVLQQKEYYADYRLEDLAEHYNAAHPEAEQALKGARDENPALGRDTAAQLEFYYKHTPYYEQEHLRYPVYRIE